MKKKSAVRTWIIMILLAAAVLAGYFIVSDRQSKKQVEPEVVQTEVTKLLDKNLETDYPLTAREVVKLYSRFLQCLYVDSMTEPQQEELAAKMRMLFDDELLGSNSWEDYLADLRMEISDYRTKKWVITGYQIEKADSAITWQEDGMEYARLMVLYAMRKDTVSDRVCEEFILRRTGTETWKILGWRLADEGDMDLN